MLDRVGLAGELAHLHDRGVLNAVHYTSLNNRRLLHGHRLDDLVAE